MFGKKPENKSGKVTEYTRIFSRVMVVALMFSVLGTMLQASGANANASDYVNVEINPDKKYSFNLVQLAREPYPSDPRPKVICGNPDYLSFAKVNIYPGAINGNPTIIISGVAWSPEGSLLVIMDYDGGFSDSVHGDSGATQETHPQDDGWMEPFVDIKFPLAGDEDARLVIRKYIYVEKGGGEEVKEEKGIPVIVTSDYAGGGRVELLIQGKLFIKFDVCIPIDTKNDRHYFAMMVYWYSGNFLKETRLPGFAMGTLEAIHKQLTIPKPYTQLHWSATIPVGALADLVKALGSEVNGERRATFYNKHFKNEKFSYLICLPSGLTILEIIEGKSIDIGSTDDKTADKKSASKKSTNKKSASKYYDSYYGAADSAAAYAAYGVYYY